MQLLAGTGRENGTHKGLGILPDAEVVELDAQVCPAIPHMGWNNLESTDGHPLFRGLASKPDFYFVHSYHMVNVPSLAVVNTCIYGETVTAAIAYKNIFGTQFHPEKSQANGLKVLRNFIEYA
jgi:glutamine amidotransferase